MNKTTANWIKRGLLGIISLILIAVLAIGGIFRSEIKTLTSIEKLNDYPFYTMTYAGDYGFDDFLEVGAKTDQELVDFIVDRLLKGLPINIDIPDLACSTFSAQTPEGDYVFGRNFDLDYAPPLLVKTTPDNGYRSISMINLAFLGYDENKLPDNFASSILTLAAPYIPLDGINEKGLSIGVLLIPTEPTKQDTEKVDINTTTAVRLVLDKAATIQEAVQLLQQYDMNASANRSYHFQIADATGASVVVEYIENEMSLVTVDTPYQACTNFLLTPGDWYNFGKGQDRYETLINTLNETQGILTEGQAMDLLKAASQPFEANEEGVIDGTQWSVVYNNTDGTATIAVGQQYENTYDFDLNW